MCFSTMSKCLRKWLQRRKIILKKVFDYWNSEKAENFYYILSSDHEYLLISRSIGNEFIETKKKNIIIYTLIESKI